MIDQSNSRPSRFIALAQAALGGFAALSLGMIFVSATMALWALVDHSEIASSIRAAGISAWGIDEARLPVALAVFFTGTAAMFAAMWRFLRNLRLIVGTVSQGDPFLPTNAARLQRMAWLMLAIQVLAVPVKTAAQTFRMAQGSYPLLPISGMGLLFVLVLFVLAQVFRQGAVMRDDLEGTV